MLYVKLEFKLMDSHGAQTLTLKQPANNDDVVGDNNDAARVSVVVPSHNHARFIAQTLRSIIRQTHAPAELLVIDDGSSDDSPRIIEQALKDCPFPCELVVRGGRGLCATLNEGLARSTRGRYFAYLGSDDLWLEDFLRERVRLLEARPRAVLAYGHAHIVDAQNHIVDSTKDWAVYADGDARGMLLRTIGPMSPTVCYRRAPLARLGWNETARLEDYELYLRLCVEGEFAFDPRVHAAWRRHETNTSWNQLMMLEEQLRAQQQHSELLGLSDGELARLQRKIKFTRAEDFLRLGEKREAWRLMSQNFAGHQAPRALARMLIRLLVPSQLMRRRSLRAGRRATERYGSIQI